MVVDLVVIYGVVPGGFAFALLVVMEKGIVISGGGAGRTVAGLVDDDPFDVTLYAGPSGKVFRDQIGMHRDRADIFGINGLRLTVGAAAD